MTPPDIDALMQDGFALLEAERWAEALELFNRIIEADPNNGRAHYGRGWANEDLGRYAECIADCDEAIRLGFEHADLHRVRSHACYATGDFAGTLADCNYVLDRLPDDVLALDWRAEAYNCLKRHREAIADLDRVIAAMPSAHQILRRAQQWQALGEMEKSVADLAASRDDPKPLDSANAINERALAWIRANRLDEALADFETGVRLAPGQCPVTC